MDLARGGIPLFTLNLLFCSKPESHFFMIKTYAVFTVQLNGSGRAEIGMTLPDYAKEELDIEVTDR